MDTAPSEDTAAPEATPSSEEATMDTAPSEDTAAPEEATASEGESSAPSAARRLLSMPRERGEGQRRAHGEKMHLGGDHGRKAHEDKGAKRFGKEHHGHSKGSAHERLHEKHTGGDGKQRALRNELGDGTAQA